MIKLRSPLSILPKVILLDNHANFMRYKLFNKILRWINSTFNYK